MTIASAALIETMRVAPGNLVPLLAWHKSRLQRSCRTLGFVWPGASLFDAIAAHVRSLDPAHSHRLRLLLQPAGRYTLESAVLASTAHPVLIRLSPSALTADPFWLRHKTTHRPWFAEAQEWLVQHPDFFDVVFCNSDGQACEGTRSNVYILDSDGSWLTPPLESGLLPGVKRQALLDTNRVKEAMVSRSQLLEAKALRISNALRGWLPARLITDPADASATTGGLRGPPPSPWWRSP